MGDFRTLLVYQRSVTFAKLIYRLTNHFPKEEMFGTTSQLRRASTSIMANIAEGSGRNTTKDFLKFLYIARGSLFECECFLEFAKEVEYITTEQYDFIEKKRGEVGFLLYKFILSQEKNI